MSIEKLFGSTGITKQETNGKAEFLEFHESSLHVVNFKLLQWSMCDLEFFNCHALGHLTPKSKIVRLTNQIQNGAPGTVIWSHFFIVHIFLNIAFLYKRRALVF